MSGHRRWQGKVFIATSLDGYIARGEGTSPSYFDLKKSKQLSL